MTRRQVKHHRPGVTVLTDASWDQQHAGWAGWAAVLGRFHETSGPMKVYKQSDTMELAAMANMLSHLSIQGLLLGHKAIVIQMDNKAALSRILRHLPGQAYVAKSSDIKFQPTKKPATGEKVPMLDTIRDLLDEFEIVYLKHVRGHQSKEAQQASGRVGVHERCDKAAKAARKAQKLNIEEVKE